MTVEKRKQIKDKLKEIEEEMTEVIDKYFTNGQWKKGFIASEWKYYKEYTGKSDWEEWDDHSVISYLNFLISKKHNLYLKLNREYQKGFSKK